MGIVSRTTTDRLVPHFPTPCHERIQRGLPPPPNSWAAHEESEVAIWRVVIAPGGKFTLPPAAGGAAINRMLYYVEGKASFLEKTSYLRTSTIVVHPAIVSIYYTYVLCLGTNNLNIIHSIHTPLHVRPGGVGGWERVPAQEDTDPGGR